ncbi:MAG: hypothetical protein LBH16_08170 [Treponema sp.]|jgi:hypothetical protein|nr:hypothetical protein [Treponema sp.]
MRKLHFIIVLTSLFLSCDIFAETNSATYIYQGRYSADVVYRKENYLIYEGRYGSIVAYRIENNLIYIGRVENNLIYQGRYGAEVLYRVER